MYKQPQKIITHYATQKYDLKRSQSGIPQGQTIIIRYSTQKYDLKRSQSGIPHGQMTSKDHNPVFHMDKQPQKIIIRDRKSTRLNSSHANISYAVFCLKKKKIHQK